MSDKQYATSPAHKYLKKKKHLNPKAQNILAKTSSQCVIINYNRAVCCRRFEVVPALWELPGSSVCSLSSDWPCLPEALQQTREMIYVDCLLWKETEREIIRRHVYRGFQKYAVIALFWRRENSSNVKAITFCNLICRVNGSCTILTWFLIIYTEFTI